MNLKPYVISETMGLNRFRPVLLLALAQIDARSGGDYPPDKVLESFQRDLPSKETFALWLAVDEDKLAAGVKPNDAVAGVMTLEMREDFGTRIAYVTRGWARLGYRGAPFALGLPLAEKWAVERGAAKLRTLTERSSAAAAGERFELASLKARLSGLLAYAKWIYRHGFVMRVTVFEKDLKK